MHVRHSPDAGDIMYVRACAGLSSLRALLLVVCQHTSYNAPTWHATHLPECRPAEPGAALVLRTGVKHVATRCSTLQHSAPCCNAPRSNAAQQRSTTRLVADLAVRTAAEQQLKLLEESNVVRHLSAAHAARNAPAHAPATPSSSRGLQRVGTGCTGLQRAAVGLQRVASPAGALHGHAHRRARQQRQARANAPARRPRLQERARLEGTCVCARARARVHALRVRVRAHCWFGRLS
jgi:hypothetical protein